jgi:glycosyltransferase involved in cell wall biosynthesis
MNDSQKISLVIPALNEERNISLVFNQVSGLLEGLGLNPEFIFVNDGSQDGTWSEIEKLCREHPNVQGVNLTRNFGHAVALEVGLNFATGDAIVMLDADLQHPPALIPELINEWRKGFEVVNTVRLGTAGISRVKSLSSRIFYRFINSISELHLSEGEADFRLISKRVNESLKQLPESPKFYRGLINWLGFPTSKVEFSAPERLHGKSSYNLKKMFEFARLGITSFSKKPLKIIAIVGSALTACSLLALTIVVFVKLFVNQDFFSGLSILVLFLALVTGIMITFQGIVALYLVDIFQTAKGRPSFIIKEVRTRPEQKI